MTLIRNLAGSRNNPAAAGVYRALARRNLSVQVQSEEEKYYLKKKNSAKHEADSEHRNFPHLMRYAYDYMMLYWVRPEIDRFHKRTVRAIKAGRMEHSLSFHNKMTSLGLVPDVAVYEHLISKCGKCKISDDAIWLLDEMKRSEVKPTEQTLLCLLHACASTGRLDRIYAIVLDMAEAGLGLNKFYYAGMITAHLNQTPRTDDISSKIIDIVEQSKHCSRVCPRTITKNFMMNVCEEELYNLPTADYVNSQNFFLDRDLTVYHVAFHALGELRDVQAISKLLEMLKKYRLFPDTYINIQIMRCYLHLGDLDRGLKAFEDCKMTNVLICADIYVALAEGAMLGYTPRGMQIARESLVNMIKRNLYLNLKSGDNLLRIAAGEKTGGYTTANLIWDMMQARKLVPSLPTVNAYYNGLRGRDIPEHDPRVKLVAQTLDRIRLGVGPGGDDREDTY